MAGAAGGKKGKKIGRKAKKGTKFPAASVIARTPMLAKGATWKDAELKINPSWISCIKSHLKLRNRDE